MCARYKADDGQGSGAPRRPQGNGNTTYRAGATRPRPRVTAKVPPPNYVPYDEMYESGDDEAFTVSEPSPRAALPQEQYQDPYQQPEYRPAPSPPRSASPKRHHTPLPAPLPLRTPWDDVVEQPKKGTSFLGALWIFFGFPFRLIGYFTRALPFMILWPIRIIISVLFVSILAAVIFVGIYAIKSERYDISQIKRMPSRTIVLDRKGHEIGTLHGENRRSITDLKTEVPRYFVDALIVQEDRSFWEHGGVDMKGVARAIQQVYKHKRATQGASTITMQLAKNTYNHRERNLDAKLMEVALARRMEAVYDKETILTCYINRVFWGHTFLGLKQAAYGYFGKEPRDLTIGEAALLAGIVCSPNEFSPHRNPSAAKVQRDKVLKLMFEFGYIRKTQYELALAEELVTKWPERRGDGNYALDLIRSEVDFILELLEREQQSIKEEAVFSGGFVVRTTLDLDFQDEVMGLVDSQLVDLLEKRRGYKHQTRAQYQAALAQMTPEEADKSRPQYVQGACVVVNNASGALLAVVGGRNGEESPLNRAVQSRRQVGSLFKPLVYASFFQRGGSPQTMISDNRLQPGEIAGARNWNPSNADGRFTGSHPASWGLLKSRNTMSVRVGSRAGLKNVVDTALLSGYRQGKGKPGPTIYLGTWEASPLEVASSYTTFANGGVRATPYIIESITDANGRVLWRNQTRQQRVFSQQANKQTSEILQQITKPGGTAASTQRLGFKHPCGGKTGTTNSYKNAWFCGFSSDLTAAVWVGFDRPRLIVEKGYGGTLALPIWVEVMKAAERRGYPMHDISNTPRRAASVGIELCRSSGNVAHAGCRYEGTAYIETMTDLDKPRSLCQHHSDDIAVDPDEEEDDIAIDPDEEDEIAIDPDEEP